MSNLLTADAEKISVITPESISPEEFRSLQDYAVCHHQFNIEEAHMDIENGGSIHQGQRVIESNQQQINEIYSCTLGEITQEQLTALIHKARSGQEEAMEKITGSDLREPKPELSGTYLKIYDRFMQQGFGEATPLPPVRVFIAEGDAVREFRHQDSEITDVGYIALK